MHRVEQAILLLVADDAPMVPECADGAGTAGLSPERRVGRPPRVPNPDGFLLNYQRLGQRVIFVRTGSHADLFEQ